MEQTKNREKSKGPTNERSLNRSNHAIMTRDSSVKKLGET
jgi:hypothetical protein